MSLNGALTLGTSPDGPPTSTPQTISFVSHVAEVKNSRGPHLILAPKAVLPNWRNEFAKWASDLNVVFYDGSGAERAVIRAEQMATGTFNVILTHYDLVIRDKAHLRKFDYELLIVDEGHRLKNSQSKLSDILREHYDFKHRFLLTGTPIQNSIEELWALLNFVLPKVFSDIDSFGSWFAAPFSGSSEDVSQQLNEEESLLIIHRLHQVIRPFLLRRTKSEVEKDLPDKTQQIIKCDMSAWQKLLYRQITSKSKIEMGRGRRQLANQAMQMRKACNHPYLFLNEHFPTSPEEIISASGKMWLLDNILPKLKSTGHRVLLFCQMTKQLDILEDYLAYRGYKHMRLDGTTNTSDRSQNMAMFNEANSEYFIFMLSTRAGGLGLNLQTADTVIMFDSDWNPQADQQAEDRAHRIGQKRQVLVLVFVTAGSIEEAIQSRAREKRDLDAKVIQAGMFNEKSTHADRQELLEQLMKQDGDKVGQDVHTLEQVNILMARSEDELQAFNDMDAEAEAKGTALALGGESEIPEWVREPEAEAKEDGQGDEAEADAAAEDGRRSRRRRTDVVYDENLSEEQFCALVERGATNVRDQSLSPSPHPSLSLSLPLLPLNCLPRL